MSNNFLETEEREESGQQSSENTVSDPIALLIKTKGAGYGSAFFVCKSLIATNIHVVAGATSVSAELIDPKTDCVIKKFIVEGVTAFDGKNDLLILKTEGEGTPLSLSDSDAVQSGEIIHVIGYPSEKHKVTKGAIHSIWNNDKWLRMKVKAAKGNSGGPVLNSKGQVIAIQARGDGFYSYAIPSNALKVLTTSKLAEPLVEWNKREISHAYAYYLRGEDKYRAGHYEEAITYLDKAIHLCPDHAIFYGYRGRAKSCLGKSKAQKGNIVEAQKHYKDAIDDHAKTLQIDPKLAEAYDNRGWAQSLLGKSKAQKEDVTGAQHHYKDAICDYTEAIKLNPEAALAYNNRGYTKYLLGKSKDKEGNIEKAQKLYKEAKVDCNIAIKLEPCCAEFYYKRGEIKVVLEDLSGAKDDYSRTLKCNPNHVRARCSLQLAKERLSPE